MVQARDGSSLRLESSHFLRPGVHAGEDHLQRDDAVQADLSRLVDHAHATPAQLPQNLVAGKLLLSNLTRTAGDSRDGWEWVDTVHRRETLGARRCRGSVSSDFRWWAGFGHLVPPNPAAVSW